MQAVVLATAFTLAMALVIPADPKPATQGLKRANDEFGAAMLKAKADYDSAVKKAATELRDKMKSIQADCTKAGDLDGALAVRNMIAELDASEPANPSRPKELVARDRFASALSKVIWQPSDSTWGGKKFVFSPDGTLKVGKEQTGIWVAISPSIVIVWLGNGIVDMFEIDLGKGTAKVRNVGAYNKPTANWEATITK